MRPVNRDRARRSTRHRRPRLELLEGRCLLYAEAFPSPLEQLLPSGTRLGAGAPLDSAVAPSTTGLPTFGHGGPGNGHGWPGNSVTEGSYLDAHWRAERESIGAPSNDTPATAQHLNVGTGPGDDSQINILGSLDVTAREISVREDDGSIPKANRTGLRAGDVASVIARGHLGDGPHGSSGTGNGDYDYYKFSAQAGQLISINVEGESIYSPYQAETFLDPVVALYDAAGNVVTYNDNNSYLAFINSLISGFPSPTKAFYDPGFRLQAPATGEYYVVVFSSVNFQTSPFDSGSGAGVFSEGDYFVSITLESPAISSVVGEAVEDGAIPFATETGIVGGQDALAYITGYVGDGLHGQSGTGRGDFDMFRFEANAGEAIYLAPDTDPSLNAVFFLDEFGFIRSFGMDTKILVYDPSGNIIWFNEDGMNFDAAATFYAPYTGSYYISVSGYSGGNQFIDPEVYFPNNFLADPFDPDSGGVAGLEGFYSLYIKKEAAPDVDYYSLDLQPGDVLSVAALGDVGAARLFDPDGQQIQLAYIKENFHQIDESPLYIATGDVQFSRVISQAGRYTLQLHAEALPGDAILPYLTPTAPYNLNVRVERPGLESQPMFTHQVLYLDFDGVPADSLFYNRFFLERELDPTVGNLSPFRDYLVPYGLSVADEDYLIDGMISYAVDRLVTDMGGISGRGANGEFLVTDQAGDFQLEILNSRDHADVYIQYPNVSRVIIGSSMAEIGDPIGGYLAIANAIDVGNYDLDDQAIVLTFETFRAFFRSINEGAMALAPGVDIRDAVIAIFGSVIAHEAGHNFGSFHTDPVDDIAEIMDPGGPTLARFIQNLMGVGPDLTFGTGDDVQTRFEDLSTNSEFGYGTHLDSHSTVAFGLSTGTQSGTYFDFVTGTLYVSGDINDGHKDELKVKTSGANLKVYVNNDLVLTRPSAAVNRVVLNGSSDRDTLDASQFDGVVLLQGKAGNDKLYGGNSHDLLLGGDGDDELDGGNGHDILVGGAGSDVLFGGKGSDVLIGGTGSDTLDGDGDGDLLTAGRTSYDSNAVALGAIRSEWTRTDRTYWQKVQNLTLGGGLNGLYKLDVSGSDATVFDDSAVDKLRGRVARDLFFARLAGAGLKDRIQDLENGEEVKLL